MPRDPTDWDEYDAVYRWAFDHFPRYLWCDEAGDVFPSHGGPRQPARLIGQGRKRELGHLACHYRPIDCSRKLVSQAAHVMVFDTPAATDRKYLADNMGVDRDTFEQLHAALPQYGFLHFDRRAKTLTPCAPLPH